MKNNQLSQIDDSSNNKSQNTTYLVKVVYDGSHFFGWSRQPKLRTVESEITTILKRVFHLPITIDGSSRTDTGVHAYAQFFTFSLPQAISQTKMLNILQHNFNNDIKIMTVTIVARGYDLRKHVTLKEYRYIINTGASDPFRINYEYQYNQPLDIAKLNVALQYFVGKHYFYNFSGLTKKDQKDPYRTVKQAVAKQVKNQVIIRIQGNGFLRYQVRCLISAAINYCAGKITLVQIREYLKPSCQQKYPLPKVPAGGLYLYKTVYK